MRRNHKMGALLGVILLLVLGAMPTFAHANEKTGSEWKNVVDFTDVPKDFWGYQDIMDMVELGYLNGTGNGRFEPNKSVTYAEFLTMLANIFYEVEGYPNITNKPWYYDNVRWLVERGIMNDFVLGRLREVPLSHPWFAYFPTQGYHGEGYLVYAKESMPYYDVPITRNYMAIIMYNLGFNSIGQIRSLPKPEVRLYNREGTEGKALPEYDNYLVKESKKFLQVVIDYNYKNKFLQGINDKGDFGGERHMTRAEAAAVLKRMYAASTVREQPTRFKDILVEKHYTRKDEKEPFEDYPYADYDILAVYRPGKLTNGKPNTRENRIELLKEIEEAMPSEKHWAYRYHFPGYEHAFFNDTIGLGDGACNGYASFIATALYGQYAPLEMHHNLHNADVGDIWASSIGFVWDHVQVIIGKAYQGENDGWVITDTIPTGEKLYYLVTDGNSGGMINWDWRYMDHPHASIGLRDLIGEYPDSQIYTLDESNYDYTKLKSDH